MRYCICRNRKPVERRNCVPYRSPPEDDPVKDPHKWWCFVSIFDKVRSTVEKNMSGFKRFLRVTGISTFLATLVLGAVYGGWVLYQADVRTRKEILENARQVDQRNCDYAEHTLKVNNACAKMCESARVLSCHITKDPSWTDVKLIAVCLNSNATINADVKVGVWKDKVPVE